MLEFITNNMPLMRFAKLYSLLDTSVSAGFTTPEIDVSKVRFIQITVKSNVANTFYLQFPLGTTYYNADSISVSAGGIDNFYLWAIAVEKIKVRVSNAATISIEVRGKV
ncbi:MAG: hypothetical protein ABIM54_00825 [candidate division WOR-3 bacterium]